MIKNEEEFQNLMQEVDSEMITEEIPVSARQMVACSKVAKKLAITLPMGGFGFTPREPKEGVYSGYDLALRIKRWFSDLYGSKLKVDFDIGVIAVEVSGEIYKMRLPTVFGRVGVVIDPSTMGMKGSSGRINILDLLEDLTPPLASRLTREAFDEICELFVLGMDVFGKLQTYRGDELLAKAHADFKASTFHLLHRPPELGLSKWASLQAVEKTLKSLIARQGRSYPKGGKGHELDELSKIFEKIGLPPVEKLMLEKVQCKPGVRYENAGLTVKETVDAQHIALRICQHAFKHYL